MENLINALQVTVAISVAYVWIFRYHNVIKEFKEFGLTDITRNAVGTAKISIATLLVAGIWFTALVFYAAVLMGLFMMSAQFFHFKTRNSFIKHLPSLILLILCAIIAVNSMS
tara:strand:+ start:120 stop:458 length:339 start_codon:yes stop_codon:yes gene_type:complete